MQAVGHRDKSDGHRQIAGPECDSASPASLQARTAMSWIPALIEEEFDASQFLEGCKGAFVAGAGQPGWTRTCFHAVKRLLWLVTQACCSAWMLWRGPCSLSELTVRPLHSRCFLPALQCRRACLAQETWPQWCRFHCSTPMRKRNTFCSLSPQQQNESLMGLPPALLTCTGMCLQECYRSQKGQEVSLMHQAWVCQSWPA